MVFVILIIDCCFRWGILVEFSSFFWFGVVFMGFCCACLRYFAVELIIEITRRCLAFF